MNAEALVVYEEGASKEYREVFNYLLSSNSNDYYLFHELQDAADRLQWIQENLYSNYPRNHKFKARFQGRRFRDKKERFAMGMIE